MKNTFTYRINDSNKFLNDFTGIVDTTVDCNCNSIDPTLLKADYFGKFESGEFTISHESCEIFVTGTVKDQELSIKFHFPNRFNAIFDIVIFTLVGISIMYDVNLYLGISVTLFVIIQKLTIYNSEEKKKKAFLKKFEEIIIPEQF